MKVIMLGVGLVGEAIVKDLAKDIDMEVTAADVDQANLDKLKDEFKIKIVRTDLSDSSVVSKLVKNYDLVIGALPGHLGFSTLKTVMELN